MHDSVTVVVPTAGTRPTLLRSCLGSIDAQTEPHDVVIAVPPGRILPPEIRATREVVVVKGSIAAALNAGIREARGRIIATIHDDCRVAENWLREISEPLRSENVFACIGQTLPARPGKAYPSTHALSFADRRFISTKQFVAPWDIDFIGNNFAVRRETIGRVGPFNESLGVGSALRGGEDLDMIHRILAAGLTICVNPRALAYHEPLDTWHQVLRMTYSYRTGLAAYFWCHRTEPDVGDYFVSKVVAEQVRQVWRSMRNLRVEDLTLQTAGLLGLAVGLAKSELYRP